MNKQIASLLVICLLSPLLAFGGLDSKKSMYVGGTTTQLKEGSEGVLNTTDQTTLTFQDLKIPYDKVTYLGYGQHAGRRVGSTIALGVTTLGIGALPMLFSKKRRHYLTLQYNDENGKEQAAIFEIGKDAIRTTLTSLQVRTGKKIEYEDDEARKAGNK